MSFAAGVYTLPAGNPVVTATTIQSSWANTTLSDIATALSTCVLKDGTQTLTANIPMGGFKLTGLTAGTSANDSVSLTQLQSNTTSYLTGTAGTNTITASASPTLSALVAGQRFFLIPANTNTGATTLQINSTAATNVFWNNAALVGGEIRQNVPIEVFYDGTQYQLISSGATANTFAIPDTMRIQAAGDRTKMFMVSVTGVATGVTTVLKVPSSGTGVFVGDTLIQTLTNKTLTSPVINTLVTGTAIADQTAMEAASSTSLIVSPGNQLFHPSAAKGWGKCTPATTVNTSFPAGATLAKNGTGDYTVTFARTFSSTSDWVVIIQVEGGFSVDYTVSAKTATTFRVLFFDLTTAAIDPVGFTYSLFGDL